MRPAKWVANIRPTFFGSKYLNKQCGYFIFGFFPLGVRTISSRTSWEQLFIVNDFIINVCLAVFKVVLVLISMCIMFRLNTQHILCLHSIKLLGFAYTGVTIAIDAHLYLYSHIKDFKVLRV